MQKQDWTGNNKSIYTCLGASNHVKEERQIDDYYATDPKAIQDLLRVEDFCHYVWECACGGGHLVNELRKAGYDVKCSDIVDRGCDGTEVADFLKTTRNSNDIDRDIITNPPYKYASEFVEHALDISMNSTKVAMFLKLTFLEGQKRKKLFEKYPPKKIYVYSSRIKCAKNGEFEKLSSSAVCYAWFVWKKGYKGKPTIDWI